MLKIEKRFEMSEKQKIILRVVSVLAALFATAVILFIMGHDPLKVFGKMIGGSFKTSYMRKVTVRKAIPLITMALGVAVAFKMKFLNIGAEGQFFMGAFGCAVAARSFSALPTFVLLPIMFVFGIAFGAVYALIPAFLRQKFGTSETLVTLMMNYMASLFVTYLQTGPWETKEQGGNRVDFFSENAWLPEVFGVHIGWIIVILLAVVLFVLFKRTKLGFEISVVGENMNTARYAGMNVGVILFSTAAISGGICGLAGMLEAAGSEHRISDNLSAGMGFTAIIVAWLAALSPFAIIVVGFMFAILMQGSSFLQSMNISSQLCEVIQGIILFFVLASEFFVNYRIVWKERSDVR